MEYNYKQVREKYEKKAIIFKLQEVQAQKQNTKNKEFIC